jgi:hypothetical protein
VADPLSFFLRQLQQRVGCAADESLLEAKRDLSNVKRDLLALAYLSDGVEVRFDQLELSQPLAAAQHEHEHEFEWSRASA